MPAEAPPARSPWRLVVGVGIAAGVFGAWAFVREKPQRPKRPEREAGVARRQPAAKPTQLRPAPFAPDPTKAAPSPPLQAPSFNR